MLHITFRKAKENGACKSSYTKMAKAVGGIKKYGQDTPIALDKVIEICGVQDATWALRCTIEPSEDLLIEFACKCAEHVLHFYEEEYPDDKRPRLAVEASRHCIKDKSAAARAAAWDAARAASDAARAAAWAASDAARAAAWAAAWVASDAARAAAWAAAWVARAAARAGSDAAWVAEMEWQTQILLSLLK